MIISHKYKYVCLNPAKTGSGYRELCLHDSCDIIVDKGFPMTIRHMDYASICKFFEENNWNIQDYYTFTFVRNPWKRYASWYNMLIYQKRNRYSFRDYIKNWKSQDDYFLRDGKQVVDFVGDCDTQTESLQKIFLNLGLDISLNDIPIPRLGIYTEYNYKDFYIDDPTLIDFVAEKEKSVINTFNFKF